MGFSEYLSCYEEQKIELDIIVIMGFSEYQFVSLIDKIDWISS